MTTYKPVINIKLILIYQYFAWYLTKPVMKITQQKFLFCFLLHILLCGLWFVTTYILVDLFWWLGLDWDQSSYDDINGAINFGDGGLTRYPLAVIDLVGHGMLLFVCLYNIDKSTNFTVFFVFHPRSIKYYYLLSYVITKQKLVMVSQQNGPVYWVQERLVLLIIHSLI